nr:phage portal protein [Anaerolineae bacterium]
MLTYPDYSDLSMSPFSDGLQLLWDQAFTERQKYHHYFSGEVFHERVQVEDEDTQGDPPLLYPVGMNLVRTLCVSQSEALFGEWEDMVMRFRARQDVAEDTSTEKAIEWAHQILTDNHFETLGYELALDREVYKGCAVKISFDLTLPSKIRLSRLPLDYFYPIWDPDNPDRLLEAYLAVPMSLEQARARYGVKMENAHDIVFRVEHWTETTYESRLNDIRIDEYSGHNPWGVVPIEYIPRMRTDDWYGDSLAKEIITVQDELNMRLADMGEAVNYNSHPIRWGRDLPKQFNARNFPVGAFAFWNLGRSLQDKTPEVGVLEVKNPVPKEGLDYINFLYDWTRTSSFSPPIAFGEDDGGGQRSGRTLQIRMWPLIRATRRSRAYFGAGMIRILHKAAAIMRQKNLGNSYATQRVLEGRLVAQFAEIMPQDEAAIVDKVVRLLTLPVPPMSLETATKELGYGAREVDRIRAYLSDELFQDYLNKKPEVSTPGEETLEPQDTKDRKADRNPE